MTVLTWIIVLVLIFANALYVAAEFAVVSVRRGRVRQLAEDGNSLAASLRPVIDNSSRLYKYIAACQLGITFSTILLGAYGQSTIAFQIVPLIGYFGNFSETAALSAASLIVLIALTMMQVVLSEFVPKSIALQFPTHAALYTFIPVKITLTLFSWLIDVINNSSLAFLGMLGIKGAGHRHIHAPDEIDLLIAESRDGGVLEPMEQDRLHSALKLVTRPARHLMVPRLHIDAIDVNSSSDAVLEKISKSAYTRLPVYQDSTDNIIGFIHTRDVVRHYVRYGRINSIRGIMRPFLSIPRNVKADYLLTMLREKRSHMAMVIDEFGEIEGLVTLEDVLAGMFGEIGDEFKAARFNPEKLPDGRVRLPGIIPVDDAEQWIGVLWEGNAETVSGHVIEALGHMPTAGELVTIDGVKVEIENVVNNVIESVIAAPKPPEDSSEEAENGR